ncbi:hypothetical protein EXIGLDRAFT_396187 [Exidia glandulosa HHB12029]|uniref:Uncharacterized protein n=1 Tax=Exidia glandulosa HHB12029 TaxID=1314781 RepID=A0A165KUM5_EXIGL|nr:hypothetical protein EXIGLDRAFT_396187 [Exidia glandulosa HHB12029]
MTPLATWRPQSLVQRRLAGKASASCSRRGRRKKRSSPLTISAAMAAVPQAVGIKSGSRRSFTETPSPSRADKLRMMRHCSASPAFGTRPSGQE